MGFKMDGMSHLQKRLNQIADKAQSNAIRDKALEAGGKVIQEKMDDLSPSTQHKIAMSLENGEAEIGPEKDFFTAHFFEFGTSPHTIKVGRRKKVLANGDTFFGKEVNHPGQRPTPFVEPAFHQSKGQAQEKMAEVIRKELGL